MIWQNIIFIERDYLRKWSSCFIVRDLVWQKMADCLFLNQPYFRKKYTAMSLNNKLLCTEVTLTSLLNSEQSLQSFYIISDNHYSATLRLRCEHKGRKPRNPSRMTIKLLKPHRACCDNNMTALRVVTLGRTTAFFFCTARTRARVCESACFPACMFMCVCTCACKPCYCNILARIKREALKTVRLDSNFTINWAPFKTKTGSVHGTIPCTLSRGHGSANRLDHWVSGTARQTPVKCER